MASQPLVLPGVLFVGEDVRQRLSAHFGPAAGWMSPKGILEWSTEVSVVPREALTEDIRRDTKAVMPEEQIPPARFPLTLEAAKRSPLVAVSSKLTSKLVEKGIRVHTIGVDRMTSSFFYIAEGGGEESMTVSGDLVQAVAEMLGDRADNAAIERVLDSLVDRLLRSLSKDRVTELGVELAASLPRAADDGSGAQGVDLEEFEKDLAKLVGNSEKYAAHLQDIADKVSAATDRKVDVPLFVDARKVPQGPFELQVGDRKLALGTYERWVMSGPFTEPSSTKAAPAVAPKSEPKPASSPKPAEAKPAATAAAKPQPSPKPAESKPAPKSDPKAADKAGDKLTSSPTPAPAKAAALAAPITPKAAPSDRPPPPRPGSKSRPDAGEVGNASVGAQIQPTPIYAAAQEAFAGAADRAKSNPAIAVAEVPKAEEPKAEPAKAEAPKAEPPKAEPPKEEPKVEAKVEPKAEAKAEAKPKAEEKPKAEIESRAADTVRKKPTAEPEANKKGGGFPWLVVLILVAVAIVVYQVFLSGKK